MFRGKLKMYQPKLFYQNVPYQDKVFSFYYHGFQHGICEFKGYYLYNSNEFIKENGDKGMHTLADSTIEVLLEGIIKIK